MTINQAISKLERLKNDLPSLVSRSIADNEEEIWSMNLENIQGGLNNDGKTLVNTDFGGVYTEKTESIANKERKLTGGRTPIYNKLAGVRYSFGWSGTFLKSQNIKVEDGKLYIKNYGMDDTPNKLAFFDGYKGKLLGLPNSDMNFVFEMINNEIWTYLKSKGL